MQEIKTGEIVIYKDGRRPGFKVQIAGATVWLSLQQIASLFGRDKSVISRHLSAIFKEGELTKAATVAKNATVQFEGGRAVKREIEYYNLDVVISIGYRVNSKRATQFRMWATQRLNEYLVKGYAVNEQRLRELKKKHDLQLMELRHAVGLFQNIIQSQKVAGYEKELLTIITDYANTWAVLNLYDKGELKIVDVTRSKTEGLDYEEIKKSIAKFKTRLGSKNEAGVLFGQEVGDKFAGVLGSIHQTFGGKDLYPSIEEKAAHLLYFCIKDHPFMDGNKRIGALLFLLFLVNNNYLLNHKGERKVNDNALAALALLIAESKPRDKDIMVKLVVNLINKK